MTTNNDSDYFCIKGIPIGVYADKPVAYLAITKANTASPSPLQWNTLAATSPEALGELAGRALNGSRINFRNQVGSNSAYLQSPHNAAPVYYHIVDLTTKEIAELEAKRKRTKNRLNMFRYPTTLIDGTLFYEATVHGKDGLQTLHSGSYAGIRRLVKQAEQNASQSALETQVMDHTA